MPVSCRGLLLAVLIAPALAAPLAAQQRLREKEPYRIEPTEARPLRPEPLSRGSRPREEVPDEEARRSSFSTGGSRVETAREPGGKEVPLPVEEPLAEEESASGQGRAGEEEALALNPAAPDDASGVPSALPSMFSTFASLLVVLGLFLLLAWLMRRGLPKRASTLPADVVEVLGQTALAPRQFVHLLRVGNKLLLVSMTGAGVETLTEITDPLEVDRLAGLCRQGDRFSSTNAFRQILGQFATERPAGKDAPRRISAETSPLSSLREDEDV